MIVSLSYWGSIAFYIAVFAVSASFASTYRINSKFMRIVLASLIPFVISGIRYNVGWDYGSYAWGFDLFDPSISVIELFKGFEFGDSIGLDLILLLTKSLNSEFLYFAITSALCFVPAFLYLANEWDDEKNILWVAIFATGFSLYFTGLSAIKQGIAIGFCLYSLTYVCKRKPVQFLLCVSIAVLFHSSALVFLPVYFLWGYEKNVKPWKKVCIIVGAVLVVAFIGEILRIFGEGRIADYGTEIVATNNYLFFLELFLLFVFLFYRNLLVELDERNELLIVLYAVAVIFMFLGFRNAFTKRIAYYFDVVQIILIPQLTFAFTERSQRIVKVLICIFFIWVCMKINSGTAENMAPIPYSFIFGG